MKAEYILDAIGLLDDGLIQEAEEYHRSRRNYSRWAGLAACLALVLTLGYAVTHLGLGNGAANNMSGGTPSNGASGGMQNTAPAASGGSAGQEEAHGSTGAANGGDGLSSAPSEPASGEGDYCAAIMVDGVLYWSTDTPVPGEVDESAIRTVTSYTDTQPEEDGQTNFDRGLTTRYAMTDMGLVVLIDREYSV